MTKLPNHAIAQVRELAEAAAHASTLPVHPETLAAISEGVAQAERGEFVGDRIVAEADQRHGI